VRKMRRRVPLGVLAISLAAAVLPTNSAAAAAGQQGERSQGASGGGPHTTIQVVAEGLDTPRGVVYDKRNHRVLVAEAGQAAGNDGPCAPGAGGAIWCSGRTSAIYQYLERRPSHSGRIVSNLPSTRLEDNTAVLGLHDIALGRHGQLNVVFGLSGRQSFRDALGPDGTQMATTATVDRNGNLTTVGDLSVFEEINNPDTRRVDSDPFGITVDDDGSTVVADAGSNGVLRVAPDGTVSLLANPAPRVVGDDPDYESVPTSVVHGPDGAYYFTELTGYPNVPGTARVLRFRPGQEPQVYEQGFTSLVDALFDERGRLIVVELAKNGIYNATEDTRTGRLIRVERDGSHTVLAEMVNPGGVAMAGPGEFYVTTNSADAGDTGQLLRVKVRG
jgi:hypothetical protein